MFPALEQLLVIQDRDRTLAQLRSEQRRIPEELDELQEKLGEEAQTMEAVKSKLKQTEMERKRWELEAETKRQAIVKYKLQQVMVKKNDEYQALTHEIESTESAISDIEGHELEVMLAIDAVHTELKQAQARINELEQLTKQKKADLEKRAGAIDAQIASVEADREALIAKVDPALLSRYQRIWEKRRDFAIARIEHDSCGGCHLKLPPQTIHIAKGEKDIASCDFCSRLLFWME